VLISTIATCDYQSFYYFDGDYSEVAKQYSHNDTKETFDPNDFMYKILIKEWIENNNK